MVPKIVQFEFHNNMKSLYRWEIQGFGSYNKAENPEVFGPGINAIRKGLIYFAES